MNLGRTVKDHMLSVTHHSHAHYFFFHEKPTFLHKMKDRNTKRDTKNKKHPIE